MKKYKLFTFKYKKQNVISALQYLECGTLAHYPLALTLSLVITLFIENLYDMKHYKLVNSYHGKGNGIWKVFYINAFLGDFN